MAKKNTTERAALKRRQSAPLITRLTCPPRDADIAAGMNAILATSLHST